MEEPPIRESEFTDEPPDYISVDDASGPGASEPDAFADEQIERHVDGVEMRDARKHSASVSRHRGPKRRRGQYSRRARRADDTDTDGGEDQKSGLLGMLGLGLIITIVFSVIGVVAIIALFGMRSSHRANPSVDISIPAPVATPATTLQPVPPPPPPPAVYRPNSRALANTNRRSN